MLPESHKGRAPSLCSLCSLRIDGGGSPLQPGALEVEQRGKEGGNSRARMSEERANEFLSRRRLRATESLEIFAKLKGELGGVNWVG